MTTSPSKFKWKAASGDILIKNMYTSHLFNTLRMIWNSKMPNYLNIANGRSYLFSSHTYPPAYLKRAIIEIAKELSTRDNLLPHERAQLDEMRRHLSGEEERELSVTDCLR